MKVSGLIKQMMDLVQVNDDFKRRTVIIETSDRGHVELISVEFFQDHTKLLEKYNEGDRVTIYFNLKGRKWTNKEGIDKYFNTLQGWKIADEHPMDEE